MFCRNVPPSLLGQAANRNPFAYTFFPQVEIPLFFGGEGEEEMESPGGNELVI